MTSEAEVLMDLEVLCPTDYFSVSYQNLCPIPVKYAYPMAININTINEKKMYTLNCTWKKTAHKTT